MSKIFVDTIEPKTSGSAIDIKPCTFRMYNSQTVAQASGSTVALTYDTVEWDTHSITDVSNNRVVITDDTAGYWFVSAKYSLDNTVPFRQIVWVYVNSTNTISHEIGTYSQTTGAYPSIQAQGIIKVVSGDIITANAYHGHGSSKNQQSGRNVNGLEGYRIGVA